ncbi:MAG: GFA family protein [Rhodocyclaceae bacterium]|nr:GFA family protein [Rhodocyclaceae bacterium]
MQELTGSCLCGNLRYRLTGEPVVSRICWCRDCQHISGNGTVNAIFPTSSIHIEGTLSEYASVADSGNSVRRRFCPHCGCHLFAENTGRPGLSVVRIGTLDDPSAIVPTANIWSSSAASWACLNLALQQYDKQPQQVQPPPSAA